MVKKKIMKVLILITVVSMIFATFTGCGNNAKKDTNVQQPAQEQKEGSSDKAGSDANGYTLPIVKKPITLTYMKREAEEPGVSFATMKPEVWEQYEKMTGIHIQFDVAPNSEYKQKLELRLAAKQALPDIVEIPGGQDGAYLSKYLEDGVLIDLSQYIEKYGVNFKKIFEKYPDYKRNLTLPNGSIVAFGSIQPSKYSYMAISVRQDWLDKLNLEMPKTIDDYYNVAKAFMEQDPNGNGKQDEFGMSSSDGLFGYYQLGMAYGLHLCTGDGWVIEDGKVGNQWVAPRLKEFLVFLNKLAKEGIIPKDFATADGKTHDARVLANQVGLNPRTFAPTTISWAAPDNTMKKSLPDAKWVMGPPPSGPYGDAVVVKEPISERWRTVGITSGCKYPEEAFKWLDWVIGSEEGQRLTAYGIEGKTYHIEDGKVVLDKGNLNEPSGNTWMGAGYVPSLVDDARFEAGLKLGGLTADSDIIKSIQAGFKFVEEPFVPPIPTPQQGKKLSSLITDMKTYRNEMVQKFVSGAIPINDDTFNDYVKNMKKIGLDEIISVYQELYDKLGNK